jgi:hypothetical protein
MSIRLFAFLFLSGMLTAAFTSVSGEITQPTVESSVKFLEEFKNAVVGNNLGSLKKYAVEKSGIGWGPCNGKSQWEYLPADKVIETLSDRSKGVKIDVTSRGLKDAVQTIQTAGWTDNKILYFDFEEKGGNWKWFRTCYFPSQHFNPESLNIKNAEIKGVLVSVSDAMQKKDFNLLMKYKNAKGLVHLGPCEGDDPGEDLSMSKMLDLLRKRSINRTIETTAVEVEDTMVTFETISWSDHPFLYFLFEKEGTRWHWTGVCDFPIRDYGFRQSE